MQKLYVKIERKKGERVITFLKKCYNIGNYVVGFAGTYCDKELTNFHCKNQANRSVEDIYSVVKTYYPNYSEKKFIKQLDKLLNKNKRLKFLFCPDIQKWVIMHGYESIDSDGIKHLNNYSNSKNKRKIRGNGKYCYNDIIELMGYPEFKQE